MIALDMRTVVLLGIISNIICTLFVVQLWRQNRRFAGIGFWVFDYALQTTALVLIVLRGAIPDWMSIVLADTLVLAGALLIYMGLERFVGKTSAQLHNYVLIGLLALAFVPSTFIHPDLHLRTFIASAGLLIICLQCLWLLWRRVERAMRALTLGVGMVFGGYCVLSVVRIAEYFVGAHAGNDYFQSGTFQTLVLVGYQTLSILLTYSLVLMVNERLILEIGTQEEKFAKAFHSAPYAVSLTRLADGTIVDVNDTFVSVTGYERAELIGKKTMDLRIWEHDADRAAVVDALTSKGKVQGMELHYRKKNGDPVVGLFSAENILIDGENSILACIEDITERKQMEDQVRQLAYYDPLTELPNRRLLEDRLSQAMAASKRSGCYGALMFLDLDNFKSLNDSQGHVVGDSLLIEAAGRLKNCVREMDTVARFGGDEFVVMISDLDPDQAESTAQARIVAEKIRNSLSEPYVLTIRHDGRADTTIEHHCSASIGVALFVDHEASQDDILKWADTAMYQAKEAGCNLIRIYDSKT